MMSIVLIGPIGSGKTTQAKILAGRLGKKFADLDDRRTTDNSSSHFSRTGLHEAESRHGIMGWYAYQKPYELWTVIKAMHELQDHVIAFGGGHSVFEDEALFQCVKGILFPHTVILFLESEDINETLDACERRKGAPACPRKLNEHFVTHSSNRILADKVIYTAGKSIQQINNEIIDWLDRDK